MTDKKSHKRTSCPAPIREGCWRKYNGDSMDGECFVCKKPISYTSFHCGHNRSVKDGGSWTIANTRPLCSQCNQSMGTMSVSAFKKKYFKKTKTKKKPKRKTTTKKKASVKKRATKQKTIDMPKISWGSSLSRLL